MNPELVCVDTNVFVRLFTQDDPVQTKSALSLIQEADAGKFTLVVNDLIMAEIAWVLRKAYKLTPVQIRKHLWAMAKMPFIEIRPADLAMQLITALDLYVTQNINYTDAYICSWMKMHHISVIYTFNQKHFRRIQGIDVRVPKASSDE